MSRSSVNATVHSAAPSHAHVRGPRLRSSRRTRSGSAPARVRLRRDVEPRARAAEQPGEQQVADEHAHAVGVRLRPRLHAREARTQLGLGGGGAAVWRARVSPRPPPSTRGTSRSGRGRRPRWRASGRFAFICQRRRSEARCRRAALLRPGLRTATPALRAAVAPSPSRRDVASRGEAGGFAPGRRPAEGGRVGGRRAPSEERRRARHRTDDGFKVLQPCRQISRAGRRRLRETDIIADAARGRARAIWRESRRARRRRPTLRRRIVPLGRRNTTQAPTRTHCSPTLRARWAGREPEQIVKPEYCEARRPLLINRKARILTYFFFFPLPLPLAALLLVLLEPVLLVGGARVEDLAVEDRVELLRQRELAEVAAADGGAAVDEGPRPASAPSRAALRSAGASGTRWRRPSARR